jgi:hypothetical protein
MNVEFGISLGSSVGLLGGGDAQKFMELVRMADGYGATAIGTYDSAFLGGDAYVRATLMALAAPRAGIGLRPSNPLTREPQVMASFLASPTASPAAAPSWTSPAATVPSSTSATRLPPARASRTT